MGSQTMSLDREVVVGRGQEEGALINATMQLSRLNVT